MVKTVKIFGERSTSTTALKALIESNSQSRVAPSVWTDLNPSLAKRLALAKRLKIPPAFQERIIDRVFHNCSPLQAWKHTLTEFEDVSDFGECHVIFCVRHPASWLLALHKRPHHIYGEKPETLSGFLNKRWKTVGREGLDRAETSATELYNRKMAAFFKLQSRLSEVGVSYSIVRHQDFAVDQAKAFSQIKQHLDGASSTFTPLETSTKDRRKSRAYYQDYYGNQRWRDEIDARSMDRIRSEIDWSVVKPFDYVPL